MSVLQRLSRRHIRFDPARADHRAAYWVLRQTGRQDSDLRFELEQGFSNTLSMMQQKIADHFSRPVLASDRMIMLSDKTRKQI